MKQNYTWRVNKHNVQYNEDVLQDGAKPAVIDFHLTRLGYDL